MKLSNRLSIYVFAVCLLTGLGITLVIERTVARNQRLQAERVMTLFQHQLVDNFKSDIGDVERQVRRSALVMERQDFENNRTDVDKLLTVMIESDTLIMGGSMALNPDAGNPPQREWMLYVNRDSAGGFSQKVLRSPEYPYPGMQWFRRPIQLGKACWSSAYDDMGGGETSMITYTMPLFNRDGRIYAVVTADISLSQLARTVAQLKPYKDSRSFLVDSKGRIMAPGDDADGSTTQTVCQGDDNIVTVTPVTGLPMSIVSVTPTASIMSVLRGLRAHFVIIMLCGTIILIILIRTLMWRLTRPLDHLSEAADSIGRGNFDTPLPDVGSYSDLNRLRTAMLHMEKSIADYVELTAREARERERIESELKVASDIQRSMLPADPPEILHTGGADISLATYLRPALEVSGDLYFWQTMGNRLCTVIADVSGKGIPASLLMVSLKERLTTDVENGMTPARILSDLNNTLCRNNPRNMFVTMQICVFDPDTLTMTIANAGHNPPAMRHDGAWRMLSLPPGLPIGIMEEMTYQETVLPATPGDALFIYTDGLTETENSDKTQFGEQRLLELLAATDSLDAKARPEEISSRIMAFAPDDAHDDMTMVLAILEADTLQTRLQRSREAIAEAARFAQRCASRWHLGHKPAYSLSLIIEEWITNIVEYTPADSNANADIDMTASFDGSAIDLAISYAAPEFNPLAQAPQVDTSAPAGERPVGGLGIYLISQLSSGMAHSYEEGVNKLEIKINTL